MNNANTLLPEQRFERIIRKVVFSYFIAEAVGLIMIAPFAFIFAPLMGGLAMAGAGNATDSQLKSGWLMISAMAVGPIILAILIILAAMNLARRKRPLLIAIPCFIAILIQIGLYIRDSNFFSISIISVLIFAFHFAGFSLALRINQQMHQANQ